MPPQRKELSWALSQRGLKKNLQYEDTLKNSDSIEEEAAAKTTESVSTNSHEPEKVRKMGPESKKLKVAAVEKPSESKETEKILCTKSSEPLEAASSLTVQPHDRESMDTSVSEAVNNEKET